MKKRHRAQLPTLLLPAGLALIVLLAACSRAPPPVQAPLETVIPETTRVADSSTLAVLSGFDLATGELRFDASTPMLEALRPDDVIVGEPTAAAPHGFLRRIHSIQQQGDGLVLQTSQANLTEAIHQGEVDATGTFGPEDLLEPTVYFEGVSVQALDQEALTLQHRLDSSDWETFGEIQPAQRIGEGYSFRVGLDEVLLDVDIEGVKVRIEVTGEIFFNAGYGAGLKIEPCFDLPPTCLTRFEVSAGLEQTARIRIDGEAAVALDIEKHVASVPFSPIVLFIGPVPVVLVPSVDIYVGANGEVRLSFTYGVTERFAALLGARWTDERGWEDIREFGLSLDGYDTFDINASFKASVYVRPEAKILLYGLVGPSVSATAGMELDAEIPRDPVWRVRAYLIGELAFEVSLPVIGKLSNYSTKLFEFSLDGRASPNSPPRVNVHRGFLRIPLRTSAPLRSSYSVQDPEEGSQINVTLRSSNPADTLRHGYDHTFTTAGMRTVHITATDTHGATSEGEVQVDVYNPPPTAFASVPFTSTRASAPPPRYLVPFNMSVGATDPIDGRLGCDGLSVQVAAPDTAQIVVTDTPSGQNCEVVAHFWVQGDRTVSVYATDQDGIRSSTRNFVISVGEPPLLPPPVITSGGILTSGDLVPSPLIANCKPRDGWRFSVTADGQGQPLTYVWQLRHQLLPDTVVLQLVTDGALDRVRFPSDVNPVPGDWGLDDNNANGLWIISVTVSNGETRTGSSMMVGWKAPVCVN